MEVGHGGDASVVALRGELDVGETGTFQEAVRAVRAGNVVVDLSRLTFLDAAGLSAILTARREVSGRGYKFVIRGAQRMVRRVFELTDLAHFLDD